MWELYNEVYFIVLIVTYLLCIDCIESKYTGSFTKKCFLPYLFGPPYPHFINYVFSIINYCNLRDRKYNFIFVYLIHGTWFFIMLLKTKNQIHKIYFGCPGFFLNLFSFKSCTRICIWVLDSSTLRKFQLQVILDHY